MKVNQNVCFNEQQETLANSSTKGEGIKRRNSFKTGFSTNKWPWTWYKTSAASSAVVKDSNTSASSTTSAPLSLPKYSGSFLRRHKGRHISCPDISSASSDSSRSTSPSSSLKVSLTSLFHRSSPGTKPFSFGVWYFKGVWTFQIHIILGFLAFSFSSHFASLQI